MGLSSSKIDDEKLRRCVVRVDVDNEISGTGFFVSPGIVLTSAHVVGASKAVHILPHESVASDLLAVTIQASSDPPRDSVLWPYPDLAILRLDVEIPHPCVWLDYECPTRENDCASWGFALREDGITPVGSPASFRFEGKEGDGYLKLKAGQAQPGLSGSPLLCPEQRAVVGIMSATRGKDSDLGGWATSTEVLRNGVGLFSEHSNVSELLKEIRNGNRNAVLSNRGAWHEVFPVEGVPGDLDQTWDTFPDHPNSSPVDLLLCEYGVVPYLFRDKEVDDMLQWCLSEAPMAVSWVAGAGGAGKTRYAIEICRRLADSGWLTGFLSTMDFFANKSVLISDLVTPRFIVIDYSEALSPARLHDILNVLRKSATDISPVRVLLLTRGGNASGSSPLAQILRLAKPPLLSVLNHAMERRNATQTLTVNQRVELYSESILNFAIKGNSKVINRIPPNPFPDLTHKQFGEPLNILFEALDYAMSADTAKPNESKHAVDRILDHEQKYWDTSAPVGSSPYLNRFYVAVATLAGAENAEEADSLLEICAPELGGITGKNTRRGIARWLNELYPGSKYLNPLRPDRLGEALVARTFLYLEDEYKDTSDSGKSILLRILISANREQTFRALDLFDRVSKYDSEFANLIGDVIFDLPNDLFEENNQSDSDADDDRAEDEQFIEAEEAEEADGTEYPEIQDV